MWTFLLGLKIKDIIMGSLGIAFVALLIVFLIQKISLTGARAKMKELSEDVAVKSVVIGDLKKNLEEIKKHEKRVEVVRYRWNTVRELVRVEVPAETPIVPRTIKPTVIEKETCERYVGQIEELRKEMAKVQDMAVVITKYFNNELRDEDYSSLRSKILPKANPAPAAVSSDDAATTP